MNYYTIIEKQVLDSVLPEQVKVYMGYDNDYTLGEAVFTEPHELIDGRWLINVQLSNAKYVTNRCVLNEIKPEELQMAFRFYGKENVFTDISNLKFKDEIAV